METPSEGHRSHMGDTGVEEGHYGVDFDDYAPDDSDEGYDQEEEEEEEDDEDEDEEEEEDEDDSELVVPDVGITRESSLASRITNESGVFSNPRMQSIAFKAPTLQTLSEELRSSTHESDADFIASTLGKSNPNANKANSRSSSVSTFKDPNLHNQFVSNAKYSESILSYDDNASTYSRDTYNDNDNDDAFSFQVNDDKQYEIGYTGEGRNDNDITDDEAKHGNDDNETDTNLTDTESLHTPTAEEFSKEFTLPNKSTGNHPVRDSAFNIDELKNEVDAMRNAFVRTDMHPSVMSKATNIVGPGAGAGAGISINYDEPLPKLIGDGDGDIALPNENEEMEQKSKEFNEKELSELDSDVDSTLSDNESKSSESIGLRKPSMKSTSTIDGKSVLSSRSSTGGGGGGSSIGATTITTFGNIPNVDIVKMLSSNKNADQNIEKLRTLKEEFNNIDTGLTEWIKFNMGHSTGAVNLNSGMIDDDKMGVHVKEALKLLEDGTLHGKNIPMATLSNIGDSLGDTMGNVAQGLQLRGFSMKGKNKKLGERGRTLLRRLRKVPKD